MDETFQLGNTELFQVVRHCYQAYFDDYFVHSPEHKPLEAEAFA